MASRNRLQALGLTALALAISLVAVAVDGVRFAMRRWRESPEQAARRRAWADEVRRAREEQGR